MKRLLQDIAVPKKTAKELKEVVSFGSRLFDGREKRSSPPFRIASPFTGGSGRSRSFRSRFAIWGAAVFLILALFVVLLSFFEKATLVITPKQQVVSFNGSFSAERGTAGGGGLAFEIMTLSLEEKKMVPATVVEQVDTEASGRIIVYNNFDSRNQQLVARTRFETKDGLIYRTREPIVVPGQRTVNGEKVPGSVEVTVYADQPGEKYNIGLVDFTIPGFKGTPRFSGFYARSKTPMTGGFSGVVKTVSENELRRTRQELGETIRTKLLEKAYSQKPDNFLLYKDATFFALGNQGNRPIQTNVNKNDVEISVSGELHGIIFNEKALSQFLAKTLIPNFSGADTIRILNIADLGFTVSNKELFSPTEDTVFSFTIQGNPYIVWEFNEDELVKDTVSKSKEEFKTVLAKYPSIKKAEVVFRPFWKGSFPDDSKRIEVKVVIEEAGR